MSLNTPGNVLTREKTPEATILRIHVRKLGDGDQALVAFRDALLREAEVGSRPLIVDLTEVEFLTSATVTWFIVTRTKLRDRGKPFQPVRRRGSFAFFPDQAAALEAIRQGEPDSLLICGARQAVMEVFVTCWAGQ